MHTVIDYVMRLPRTGNWSKRTAPINVFAIHHSASSPTTTMKAMAEYHISRGYPGIAYHYVIEPSGLVYQTQPDDAFSYHGHDFNTGLGICLTGDFTTGAPTNCQLEGAGWLLARKRAQYGNLPLNGHKEASRASTQCPGNTWPNWRGVIEAWATYYSEEPMHRATTLGVHTQMPPEQNMMLAEQIRASKIDVIKALDPDTWGQPEMFPNKRIFGRLYQHGDAWEHAFMRKGAQGANEYWAVMQGRFLKMRDAGILDWFGPNEPHPGLRNNDPQKDNNPVVFEAFWRRLIEIFHQNGARPWIWSFGVGWPQLEICDQHVNSVREAVAAGGGLEVHEYSAPNIYDGGGFHTLRIKKTLEALYAAGLSRNDMVEHVFVGECGIAWAVIPGLPDKGWRWWPDKDQGAPQYVYPAQFGLPSGVMDEERFWRHINWLDDQYALIPEIYRATPFISLPNRDWLTFDFNHNLIARASEKWGKQVWTDTAIGNAISDAIQAHVLPLNPAAALYRAAKLKDPLLVPASNEVTGPYLLSTLPENTIAQVFRKDEKTQYVAWTYIGQWEQVRWIERKN